MAAEKYQAIVFAGGNGNRMVNLTNHTPKCMLPVANIPLFWYPLNLLARNNIKDVILVTNVNAEVDVKRLLKVCCGCCDSLPPIGDLNLKLVVIGSQDFSFGEDWEEWGTADVLRYIRPHLIKDRSLLLVSGDIVSDLSLSRMLEFHSSNNSVLTCLLSDSAIDGPIPGPKERHKKYKDFVALTPESKQLLFLSEEEDYADNQEMTEKLFGRYPQVLFTQKYKDVHIYAVEPFILDVLDKKKNFSSIKADLIPYLLKGQYSAQSEEFSDVLAKAESTAPQREYSSDRDYTCYAYLCQKTDASLIAECNNISTYFEANRAVQRILKTLCPKLSVKSGQDMKVWVSNSGVNVIDSWLSEDKTEFGAKSTIKKSVIGDHCKIGAGVKIESSVLMQCVNVKDGAVIKNSILMSGAEVGEKAELGMCIVTPKQEVGPKEKLVNAVVRPEVQMNILEPQ